jgi:hypothetical protein
VLWNILQDGPDDPQAQTRDLLLTQVFPRRAQITDTAGLRARLGP